jgi:hypothetical protein
VGAPAACDLGLHVQRFTAAEQNAMDSRDQRTRLDLSACQSGYRFGCCVSLVGGDATELDRKVGHVAGGEHCVEPSDSAVAVH